MMKKQCGSISGGETSHYMAAVMVDKFGNDNCDFIFCDTGAEYEGTYEFVRETAKRFNITCIRMNLSQEPGIGGEPEIISIDEIGPNYKAFKELMAKYGRPFNPGGKFCTNEMKTMIFRKYCNAKYGKCNYDTWIGYRAEPKDSSRAWGHTLSGTLSKWFGISQREQGDFYCDCINAFNQSIGCLLDFISENIQNPLEEKNHKRVMSVFNRVIRNRQLGYRFLFEIDDSDKLDIKRWWAKQDFKLDIPPHCGNCVFCIEKTVNQLSYLCHTQNDLANEWKVIVNNPSIAKKDRKVDEKAMYRSGSAKLSFDEVYNEAMKHKLEYWESRVKDEIHLSPCAGAGECGIYTDIEM